MAVITTHGSSLSSCILSWQSAELLAWLSSYRFEMFVPSGKQASTYLRAKQHMSFDGNGNIHI